MTDLEPFEMLRRVLASRVKADELTPECLEDGTIAALAEGSLDGSARAAALPHLAACQRCRSAVASVVRALADRRVAREVAAAEGSRRRWVRIALPAAAAAAVLLVLTWPRGADDRGFPHRAPPATAAPMPLSPVGTVAEARMLRWTRVASADRYRVTLFDTGGRVLYETQLGDTVVSLPDSIVLAPGRDYLWKVEARTGWDRWSTSELVEFSIAGGALR